MTMPGETESRSEKWPLRLALLRFYARRLGWSGLVGILLVIIALIFELTAVSVTRQQAAVAERRIEALRRQLADRPAMQTPASVEQPDFFPRREALVKAIERIHALADEHGLAHGSGEYQALLPAAGQTGGLVRYRFTLPLQGAYPAWRNWLAAVMNEMPAVALSELQLKRDNVSNGVMNAQVRLTLYFEEP
jgi:hypothetical protein